MDPAIRAWAGLVQADREQAHLERAAPDQADPEQANLERAAPDQADW